MIHRRFSIGFYAIILLFNAKSMCQWQQVNGPDIGTIPSAFGGFGFIHYQAGSVWAGRDNLYVSRDSGLTWSQLPPPTNGTITEINFFNSQVGVVATTSGVYKTINGGLTWSLILNRSFAYGAQFAGSVDRIVAATDGTSAGFYYSTDGGANWNFSARSSHPHFVLTYPNGTAYAQTGSHIYFTTDFGMSWQQKGGIDYDSWYLVQDSSAYLFLMNEEGHVFADNRANFCRSGNGAVTWEKTTSFTPQYYTGGISASKCAVYCQTLTNGIVRSVDAGLTWTSIGGPNNFIDTRLVCAINSQIIIAADGNGNLWRTGNSGGLGMPSEQAQFNINKPKDVAISICDGTDIIPILYRLSSNCSGMDLHIMSVSFGGQNPSLFSLISQQPPFVIKGNSSSSMDVRFTAPNMPGNFSGLLHITGFYRDAVGNQFAYDTVISLFAIVATAPPQLQSNMGTVNFPTLTHCDRARDTTITFTNKGCDTLTILSGPGNCPPGFTFDSLALPLRVPPGGSVSIRFYFDPLDSGDYTMNAVFEAESNGITQYLPVTLNGRFQGAQPELIANDSLVIFPALTPCDPGKDTVITFTNKGCDTITILSGPGNCPQGFAFDSVEFPLILPPGTSISMRFFFDPTDSGDHVMNAVFEAESNGIRQLLPVTLRGRLNNVRPKLEAADSLVVFRTMTTCDPEADTTITLTNRGCDTLTILSGPGSLSDGFTIEPISFPIVLEPGQSITLNVHFNAPGVGAFSSLAMFEMDTRGQLSTVEIRLVGNATRVQPKLRSNLAMLTFDTLSTCNGSRDTTIILTNQGCDTLTIIDGPGALPPEFSMRGITLPIVLPPDSSLTLEFIFSPFGNGSFTATPLFTAERHGLVGTVSFFLDGTGIEGKGVLVSAPPIFQFAPIPKCLDDSLQGYITNTGCDTLILDNALLTGDADFLGSIPGVPTALAPGDTLRYTIYLNPLSKGSRSSTMTITAHSAHGSQTAYTDSINIYGVVTDGSRTLAAMPNAINFGTTTLCELPDSVITLVNEGCDTLTITAADLQGSGFLTNASLPIIILPGERKEISIRSFNDTTGGVPGNTATIHFTSNAENQLLPITLHREYQYPKRYTIEIIERRVSGSSEERVRFDLKINDELADVSSIDLDLNFNTDLLRFLSVSGPNRITFNNGGHVRISGSPIIADSNNILASLFFEIYLTKDSVSELELSNIKLNGGDSYFERCIASAGDSGSRFSYFFRCSERLLSKYMGGVQIFSIVSARPHPTYDEVELIVNAQREADLAISVYDGLGKKVLTMIQHISPGTANITMDVRNLQSGIYYIDASAANTHVNTSFIKTR